MRFGFKKPVLLALFLGMFTCLDSQVLQAQTKDGTNSKPKYEDVSFLTVDGLRLFGNWYRGNKGKNSDAVMLLPNFKGEVAKGEWNTLAEALQAEGFSVLAFDFRGHGKSKSIKTFEEPKRYVDVYSFPWNKLAGVSQMTNPLGLKSIDATKFNSAIYPYLVNDIAAARKFIDNRNDAGECNSGRISVIGDRDSCGLGMAWMGTEFKRIAIYPKNTFDIAPYNHYGSKDLVAGVWLSYRNGPGGTLTVVNNAIQADNVAREIIKDKVSMAFIYGDGDRESQSMARKWFDKWGIPNTATDDPRIAKYMIEVKNGKSLLGINLCDPSKNLDTIKIIVEFMVKTQKKQLAGSDWVQRNANTDVPMKTSLDIYGLRNP
ncbi:hypothetical protein KIH39_24370 [Telmatocola sphagniphila]|uniref:Uncharacterized protein n=1 Tax=Telmatocola sphagniphila TaxID=1123043 RepID=A0A8E6B5P1_9BACT|nr:hypothetical protein [Telmatocola sphagniphila]QVL31934.1 hypothetical protein KIH39_24370 [Telmatocola sphagniphila]